MTDNSDEPDTRPENGPLDPPIARLRAAGIPVLTPPQGTATDWRDVARGEAQKRSLAPPTRQGFTPPSKPARPEPLWRGDASLCQRSSPIPHAQIEAELDRIHASFTVSQAAEKFLRGNISSLASRHNQSARVRLHATLDDLLFRVPEAQWRDHLLSLASLRRDLVGPW